MEINLDLAGYRKAKAAFDAEHAPFSATVAKFEKEQLPGRFAEWEKAGGESPAWYWPAARAA